MVVAAAVAVLIFLQVRVAQLLRLVKATQVELPSRMKLQLPNDCALVVVVVAQVRMALMERAITAATEARALRRRSLAQASLMLAAEAAAMAALTLAAPAASAE